MQCKPTVWTLWRRFLITASQTNVHPFPLRCRVHFWNEPNQTSCNYPYCVTKKAAYRDRRLKGFHWRALEKCACVGFSKARSDLEGDFCHHVVGFRSCSAMLLDESYSWIIKWPDIKCSDRKKDDCTQSSIWNIKLYISIHYVQNIFIRLRHCGV